MGKQKKPKCKTSLVTFLSPPPSPVRVPSGSTKGSSSSPRVSLIPKEIRRRVRTLSFDTREPTSPKVSCMGQVKSKKKKNPSKLQEIMLCCGGIMRGSKGKQQMKESDDKSAAVAERLKSLGHMKQFPGGRGMLQNLDSDANVVVEDEEIEDKENVIVASSVMDGDISLQPRKEVNLWKKRSTSPPTRLQL